MDFTLEEPRCVSIEIMMEHVLHGFQQLLLANSELSECSQPGNYRDVNTETMAEGLGCVGGPF